ncbi:MAG: hypothetical protein JWP40_585 [Blastococcus sp.]|nr:hypothetical protein [Blastococcus sp.]
MGAEVGAEVDAGAEADEEGLLDAVVVGAGPVDGWVGCLLRVLGPRPFRGIRRAVGGFPSAARGVLAASGSTVGGAGCTRNRPVPTVTDAVAGGRVMAGGPGGAATGPAEVGAAGTECPSCCVEDGSFPAPASSAPPTSTPPTSTATPVATPAAAPTRRGGWRTRTSFGGERSGSRGRSASPGRSARMRAAARAAGLSRGRPDRRSVSTTWASVARSRASSSPYIGAPSCRWWPRVSAGWCGPWAPGVSPPAPLGCRVPPAGACRPGRGPVRPPGSSSCGSPPG